jgi:hypothetical protein
VITAAIIVILVGMLAVTLRVTQRARERVQQRGFSERVESSGTVPQSVAELQQPADELASVEERSRTIEWLAGPDVRYRLLLLETRPVSAVISIADDHLTVKYPEAERATTIAAAGDGTVYASGMWATSERNANDFNLYRIHDGSLESVYRHTKSISDVEFDRQGNLFFSEATGAGGDGRIYRLVGSTAEPFLTVRLSEVDGFWAGDFAFDRDNRLWLSSGNRVPAWLYLVANGVPVRQYEGSHAITGFAFDREGRVIYTELRDVVWRLTLPEGPPMPILRINGAEWLSDSVLFDED